MNITPVSKHNFGDNVSLLGFTEDQLKAYTDLIEFINSPYSENDPKRALIGSAGTGKTYLLKALITHCNISYSKIGLAAPTHKACRVLAESVRIRNVKINTLQSDLGLKLNFDVDKFDINNPPFNPRGRIKIGDYSVYIVDEASMINKGLCIFLEKICKTNKCKLIYVGDSYQLAPVKERFSSAFKGIKSCELAKIVRQDDDNPIRRLLSMLRDDIKSKSFNFLNYISTHKSESDEGHLKGFEVCDPIKFNKYVSLYFNDDEITKNTDFCKVIGYTNMCISGWNKFIRNSIIKDADKSVITKNDLLISYVTIVNAFNDVVIANSEEYILKDVVNYVHPSYELKGFLVRFAAIHGGKVTTPLFIIDHTDMFSITRYIQISNEMINSAKYASVATRAKRWKDYYAFKESCLLLVNIADNQGNLLFSRDLDYGFALTSHKSQGSTFDNTFVDVDDIVYDKHGRIYTDAEEINRRLYVACSRTKNKLYLKFSNNV